METNRSAASAGDDWADQVTDLLVDTVDKVRDRTVIPVQKAARGIVYGLVIVVLAIPIVVMLLVALVRLVDYWVPGTVWWVYLLFGLIFSGAGLLTWKGRF
jgi:Fe2+ transport system protein B